MMCTKQFVGAGVKLSVFDFWAFVENDKLSERGNVVYTRYCTDMGYR
jgi:hypothetical protein